MSATGFEIRNQRALGSLFTGILVAVMICSADRAHAQVGDPSATALERVIQLYGESRFAEALNAAEIALEQGGNSPHDERRLREWVARCHVKLGNRAEAKETFKKILSEDPAYSPDPVRVPPDEMEVFDGARKEHKARGRGPARRPSPSVSGYLSYGWFSASELNDAIESEGEEPIKNAPAFGVALRLPIRGRLALQIEAARIQATNRGTSFDMELTAIPIVADVYLNQKASPNFQLNFFAGLGPMLSTKFEVKDEFGVVVFTGNKTGFYFHGGIEGEYLWARRFGLYGRALGRYAKASNVEFEFSDVWDLDLSGPVAEVGLRYYFSSAPAAAP